MSEEEKIYQFNEYVLGYDKGLNDRSCLTISKIQNDNIYVMTTLTDGSAEVVSMILDNLQAENKRLNNIINRTTKYVESLSSIGRGCDIYEDIKQQILKELKGSDKE